MNLLPLRHFFATLFLLATTSSCMFFDLAESLEEFERVATVTVRVERAENLGPVAVVLLNASTMEVQSWGVIHEDEPVQLLCRPGDYYLAGFEDKNEDLQYEEGELAAFFGDPTVLTFTPDRDPDELLISLSAIPQVPSELATALAQAASEANVDYAPSGIARVVSWDSDFFSPAHAQIGMWNPWKFVNKNLHGMYLLSEYDSNKIPVLFVHGLAGSPLDFKPMIEQLDDERYQAWLFAYPSAMRLTQVSQYLRESIELMTLRYDPSQIAIVGHSMGGLVAREAITIDSKGDSRSRMRTLMTICAPFGGIPSADTGQRMAPVVMPCWYDLSPGSRFLRRLFLKPLPDSTSHVLAFGYGGDGGDGTVSLSSQLTQTAQENADRMIGIDAKHVEILGHSELIESFQAAFDDALAH